LKVISLLSAITLSGKSERTLWRWIADGTLARAEDASGNSKTLIDLETLKSRVAIPINPEDWDWIEKADSGDAASQNEVGLMFLSHNRPESAVYWLELSARQEYADAMHWLARCYFDGTGVGKDDNLGMMWLARAASLGHAVSSGQMQAIRQRFIANPYGAPIMAGVTKV
jgi:uncharacterized protein